MKSPNNIGQGLAGFAFSAFLITGCAGLNVSQQHDSNQPLEQRVITPKASNLQQTNSQASVSSQSLEEVLVFQDPKIILADGELGNIVGTDQLVLKIVDGDGVHIIRKVGDTDTVQEIRFAGMDAPEIGQMGKGKYKDVNCGQESTAQLYGLLQDAKEVKFVIHGKDRYLRDLAYVLADGRLVQALMVKAGYALESVSHYGDNGRKDLADQILAAQSKAPPIRYQIPWRYRKQHRSSHNASSGIDTFNSPTSINKSYAQDRKDFYKPDLKSARMYAKRRNK